MRKGVLRNVWMTAVVTVVGLGLLELLAMGWEFAQHGTIRWRGEPLGLYKPREMGAPLRFEPGATLNGLRYKISINSLGLRGREIQASKPQGTVRVWCAGGSTTFDIMVSNDAAAWPAQLERRLAKPSGRGAVEVINAGHPGGFLNEAEALFREMAPDLGVDLLVIYHGPNDLSRIAAEKFGPGAAPVSFVSELSLFRLLTDLLPDPPLPPEARGNAITSSDLAPLRSAIQSFVQAGREHGIDVVLSSHAMAAPCELPVKDPPPDLSKTAHMNRLSVDALVAAYAAMNKLFKEMAQELNCPFADVRAGVGPDPRYWGDTIHFNDEGAALAADVFAETILKAGLTER